MFEVLKDNLRQLCASYSKEEYAAYCNGTYCVPNAHSVSWCEGSSAAGKHYYDSIKGNEHIKDIACDLTCIGEDTGYEPEFLYEMFDECTKDNQELGEDFFAARKHAFDYVVGVSYEHDW